MNHEAQDDEREDVVTRANHMLGRINDPVPSQRPTLLDLVVMIQELRDLVSDPYGAEIVGDAEYDSIRDRWSRKHPEPEITAEQARGIITIHDLAVTTGMSVAEVISILKEIERSL